MGVQGLLTVILNHKNEMDNTYHEGSVLVDFHAFAFWLVGRLTGSNSPILDINVHPLLIAQFLLFLRGMEANGISFEFVVDGKFGSGSQEAVELKSNALDSRRKGKFNDVQTLGMVVSRPQGDTSLGAQQPGPGFFMTLRHCLRLAGYCIYSCDGESDSVLPLLSQMNKEAFGHSGCKDPNCVSRSFQKFCFILTNDTDLLLMKGARVCMLAVFQESTLVTTLLSLVKTHTASAVLNGADSIELRELIVKNSTIRTITSDHVAEILGVPEEDLPLLAVLKGNDYYKNPHLCPVASRHITLCASFLQSERRLTVSIPSGVRVQMPASIVNEASDAVLLNFANAILFARKFYRYVVNESEDCAERRRFAEFRIASASWKNAFSKKPFCRSGLKGMTIQVFEGLGKTDIFKYLCTVASLGGASVFLAILSDYKRYMMELFPDFPESLSRLGIPRQLSTCDYVEDWRAKAYGVVLHGCLPPHNTIGLSVEEVRYSSTEHTVLRKVMIPESPVSFWDLMNMSDTDRLLQFLKMFTFKMNSTNHRLTLDEASRVLMCSGHVCGAIHSPLIRLWSSLTSSPNSVTLKKLVLATVMLSLHSSYSRIAKRWEVLAAVELPQLEDKGDKQQPRLVVQDLSSCSPQSLLAVMKTGVRTLSLPTMFLLALDLERYKLSESTTNSLSSIMTTPNYAGLLNAVLWLDVSGHVPIQRHLTLSKVGYTIWSRLTEMFRAFIAATSLFMFGLNSPLTYEDMFNIGLFQLLGNTDINSYVSPELAKSRGFSYGRTVLSTVVESKEFKDLYSNLESVSQ